MGETIWKKIHPNKREQNVSYGTRGKKSPGVNGPKREGSQRAGQSQVRLQESHGTLGRAAKVGVTARDVGHVGGVIPGKGNHAPQGRATAG